MSELHAEVRVKWLDQEGKWRDSILTCKPRNVKATGERLRKEAYHLPKPKPNKKSKRKRGKN